MMIKIKKYSRLEEGPPKLLQTLSKKDLIESIDKEIQIYNSRLPKQKNKTYKKIQSKIMILMGYKNNLENASTVEDLSHVMSTSIQGRYRMEDPNGNILKIVYESDGSIFWDFEDDSANKSENKKVEMSAWDRLKARLDEIDIDDEDFGD